jgi:hypothetical protein
MQQVRGLDAGVQQHRRERTRLHLLERAALARDAGKLDRVEHPGELTLHTTQEGSAQRHSRGAASYGPR